MPENSDLSGQNILLGITGGIAAYKTPMLVRQLVEAGASIQVVMSENAHRFVTTTTLQEMMETSLSHILLFPLFNKVVCSDKALSYFFDTHKFLWFWKSF